MDPEIKITAQPEANTPRCKFTVDRPVHQGRLAFGGPVAARNSPLATKLFELGHVAKVEINGAAVTVAHDGSGDWGQLARQVGAAIRAHLKSGEPVVNPGYEPQISKDEALRDRVQSLLDIEVNPSVASHGGYIEIIDVKDAKAFIKMSGGCQGCGAADVTLKQGVEKIILEKVPEVVAVLDTTDHASGSNPYYQPEK